VRTSLGSSVQSSSTCRTFIALLFSKDPLFRSVLSPIRDRSQNDPLAHGHWELVDKRTGEIGTQVTSLKSLLLDTLSNRALPTKHRSPGRLTPITEQVISGQRGHIWEAARVNLRQSLQESPIVVSCRVKNPAHATIQSARSDSFGMYLHRQPFRNAWSERRTPLAHPHSSTYSGAPGHTPCGSMRTQISE